MKNITYIELDCHELEELVETHFPSKVKPKNKWESEWEFAIDQEYDSDHTFTVDAKPINEYHLKMLEIYRETGKYAYLASTFLNALCIKGVIVPGKYLVRGG